MEIFVIVLAIAVPFSLGAWAGARWERREWEKRIERRELMTPFGAVMYCKSSKKSS